MLINKLFLTKIFFLIIFFITFSVEHKAEENSNLAVDHESLRENSNGLISVFLDCTGCDLHYIMEAINFVNYVRDRELSQVHILVTSYGAGVSGRSYLFSFIGQKEFKGMDNEMGYWAPRTNTWSETRHGIAQRIKMGIAPYIGNTEMADRLVITMPFDKPYEREEIDDPWNNWVFEIYGGANFNLEEKQNSFNARYGFFADKISEEWKVRVRPYFNYNERNFETDDGTVTSVSRRDGFQGYAIKSLDQHWSIGMFSDILSSTFHNMHFNIDISPGIEYSIFPYDEATRRSITFDYRLGYSYNNYIETTIFQKDKENLFMQRLNASVLYQQTWGSVRAGLTGSHYFHDFRANRAEFFTRINLRLFSGFSLSLHGKFDLINDLVSIPEGDMSLEDILLQQAQLATDYQVFGAIGISYNFGSDFANVVNPRF